MRCRPINDVCAVQQCGCMNTEIEIHIHNKQCSLLHFKSVDLHSFVYHFLLKSQSHFLMFEQVCSMICKHYKI